MKNWEKYEKELKEFGIENLAVSNGNVCNCKDTKCNCCCFYEDCRDIIKINWLYSEADKPRITKRARKFLELVETGYITRDKYDGIYWFKDKPYRYDAYWGIPAGNNNCFLDLKTINMEKEFNFIDWEDEAWDIEELLKLEVEK